MGPVQTGVVSLHFGLAPYFALTDKDLAPKGIVGQTIIADPFAVHPRGRGLEVAQWLLEQHIDVVVTPDDIRDRGPGHALSDAEVIFNEVTTLARAIEIFPVADVTEKATALGHSINR